MRFISALIIVYTWINTYYFKQEQQISRTDMNISLKNMKDMAKKWKGFSDKKTKLVIKMRWLLETNLFDSAFIWLVTLYNVTPS